MIDDVLVYLIGVVIVGAISTYVTVAVMRREIFHIWQAIDRLERRREDRESIRTNKT